MCFAGKELKFKDVWQAMTRNRQTMRDTSAASTTLTWGVSWPSSASTSDSEDNWPSKYL